MTTIKYLTQTYCPVCLGQGEPVVTLARYPLTELYIDCSKTCEEDGFVDQQLLFCGVCKHAYLEKILDARFIYQNYVTTSGASHGAIDCLMNFKKFIESHVSFDSCSMLIDIGGNDSTFISYFKDFALKLINIDPNATGNERYELNRCFLEDIDLRIYKNENKKVIVSSHTIEHLEQPVELIRQISLALSAEDYCFLQFPSIECLVDNLRFDQICHQHINYFSLNSVESLLNAHGLQIIAYEYDDSHFGTLRVAVSLQDSAKAALQYPDITASSITLKHDLFKQHYMALNNLLSSIFQNGTGFGAGLMVPTLAYYLPVIDSLKYIVDENTSKHGKKFINLAPQIVPLTQLSYTDPVLITSISTKSAARAIFNKLSAIGIQNIVLPTILT